MRWAVAAVAMDQVSWCTVLNHTQKVAQTIETYRHEMRSRAQLLGILYSDMLFKSWAERAL